LSAHHDWFYFINGYEADRSASEYRLHSGDVEWWDFRDWSRAMRQQAVVGAFPEPFLHGYAGKRLPACVVGRPRAAVRILSRLLHADGSSCDANLLVLKPGPRERFYARAPLGPGKPVTFYYVGRPMRLAHDPHLARFRYEVGG
jgi:hypothetical protein